MYIHNGIWIDPYQIVELRMRRRHSCCRILQCRAGGGDDESLSSLVAPSSRRHMAATWRQHGGPSIVRKYPTHRHGGAILELRPATLPPSQRDASMCAAYTTPGHFHIPTQYFTTLSTQVGRQVALVLYILRVLGSISDDKALNNFTISTILCAFGAMERCRQVHTYLSLSTD